VDAALERKRQGLEEALWHLGRIRPLPEAYYKPIQEADWAEAWKQHYNPVKIGRRLLVLPTWLETTDPERIPVRIDPGMAFGTGTHPTTQLCLESLDETIDQGRTKAVIDIGCGSGILAVAALQLGVQHGLAVDLDLQAIEATRQNATVNEVLDRLEVGLGSVAEIRTGAFSIRSAPIVVANILAPVIVRLFGDGLADLLTSQGVLICSGVLADQSREVETAARMHGLQMIERRQAGDWVALVLIK
jgi:ribosomal protein L11 methyltransferase